MKHSCSPDNSHYPVPAVSTPETLSLTYWSGASRKMRGKGESTEDHCLNDKGWLSHLDLCIFEFKLLNEMHKVESWSPFPGHCPSPSASMRQRCSTEAGIKKHPGKTVFRSVMIWEPSTKDKPTGLCLRFLLLRNCSVFQPVWIEKAVGKIENISTLKDLLNNLLQPPYFLKQRVEFQWRNVTQDHRLVNCSSLVTTLRDLTNSTSVSHTWFTEQ